MRTGMMFAGLFVLLITFGTAQGTTLTPDAFTPLSGTTSASEPQLGGTVLVDEQQPFSFSAYGGTVSGEVQIRIVRSTLDNTLDFYWRIVNDVDSAGGIKDLRLENFISPEYNANYRTDGGSGDVGPYEAYLFSTPLHDPGFINFIFPTAGLTAGQSSLFFFMDTTATSYAKTATFDLTNLDRSAASPSYATYAPSSVPEPAAMLLLGSGFVGLAGLRKRFLKK